jgi:hypothetical protein
MPFIVTTDLYAQIRFLFGKKNTVNEKFLKDEKTLSFYNLLLLQSALQPLVGFRPAQLSLSVHSRKVLQSAVASGTSNPQRGGEPVI